MDKTKDDEEELNLIQTQKPRTMLQDFTKLFAFPTRTTKNGKSSEIITTFFIHRNIYNLSK